jgi:hypothetical protein
MSSALARFVLDVAIGAAIERALKRDGPSLFEIPIR